MGISIDLHILDYAELVDGLTEIGVDDRDLLGQILDKCGHHIGDKYVILNNEYGDGYSPWYNVMTLIERAFGVADAYEVFGDLTDRKGINYVDIDAVAEELDIDIQEQDN